MRAVNLPEFRDTAQIKAEHSVVIELFFFFRHRDNIRLHNNDIFHFLLLPQRLCN